MERKRRWPSAASQLDAIKWTVGVIAAMSRLPLPCARIPTSHPDKSAQPRVALKACHLHRPTGCDRTGETPNRYTEPLLPPTKLTTAGFGICRTASDLDHAAGPDFKRKREGGQRSGGGAGAWTRLKEPKVCEFLSFGLCFFCMCTAHSCCQTVLSNLLSVDRSDGAARLSGAERNSRRMNNMYEKEERRNL